MEKAILTVSGHDYRTATMKAYMPLHILHSITYCYVVLVSFLQQELQEIKDFLNQLMRPCGHVVMDGRTPLSQRGRHGLRTERKAMKDFAELCWLQKKQTRGALLFFGGLMFCSHIGRFFHPISCNM